MEWFCGIMDALVIGLRRLVIVHTSYRVVIVIVLQVDILPTSQLHFLLPSSTVRHTIHAEQVRLQYHL